MKILLGRKDINPNKPDENSQTPRFWATRSGYEGVVKMLLEREDANPDHSDDDG